MSLVDQFDLSRDVEVTSGPPQTSTRSQPRHYHTSYLLPPGDSDPSVFDKLPWSTPPPGRKRKIAFFGTSDDELSADDEQEEEEEGEEGEEGEGEEEEGRDQGGKKKGKKIQRKIPCACGAASSRFVKSTTEPYWQKSCKTCIDRGTLNPSLPKLIYFDLFSPLIFFFSFFLGNR